MGHRHTSTRTGLALAASVLTLACSHTPEAPLPAERTEERRLAVADGWLLGTALGLGPAVPVVFIHGVGGHHHFFDRQLTEFRSGRRVLAFDQRGCGGSADSPKGLYDLDTRVRDLAAVLDAVRFDSVILVGHGTGAQVVARYAERNPVRVLGLVIVNPVSGNAEAARVADLPDAEFRPALETWLGTLLEQANPLTREEVLASEGKARIPAMRAMLADAAGTEIVGSLAAYPGPVLILAAPGEAIPGPLRSGIETRRLSTGSHWSPLDAPDQLNAALWEFVKPLDAAAMKLRKSG